MVLFKRFVWGNRQQSENWVFLTNVAPQPYVLQKVGHIRNYNAEKTVSLWQSLQCIA